METRTDSVLTLKAFPFEERHRIVHGLSYHFGKITVIARNSIQSRRFGGSLESFAASDWTWTEKPSSPMGHLERAEVKRGFEKIRSSFERLTLASAFNELVLRVAPEREPCPELFHLHANALAVLDDGQDCPPFALLNLYLMKLLQWTGHQPQLGGCSLCRSLLSQQPEESALGWRISDAGWVCAECLKKSSSQRGDAHATLEQKLFRTSPRIVADLCLAIDNPIRKAAENISASAKEHQSFFAVMEGLLRYHLPGFDQAPLKSVTLLNQE